MTRGAGAGPAATPPGPSLRPPTPSGFATAARPCQALPLSRLVGLKARSVKMCSVADPGQHQIFDPEPHAKLMDSGLELQGVLFTF
jgi:hypothetical protein